MIVREAIAKDAAALIPLIAELGFEASDLEVGIACMATAKAPVLVAEDGAVLGCVTWHVTPVLHRPTPVGRITMLVVAPAARSAGVGRALVGAVEDRCAARGCALIEVTSNLRLADAHAFYRRLGYVETSRRFVRSLIPL